MRALASIASSLNQGTRDRFVTRRCCLRVIRSQRRCSVQGPAHIDIINVKCIGALSTHRPCLERVINLAAMEFCTLGLWLLEQRTRLSPGAIFRICTLARPFFWDRVNLYGSVSGYGVVWSPDSSRVAFHAMGTLYIYTRAFRPVCTAPILSRVKQLVWSPDGTRIAIVYYDKHAQLYQLGSSSLLQFSSRPGYTNQVLWTLDGKYCMVGSSDGHLDMHTASGRHVNRISMPKMQTFNWSPDQTKLLGYSDRSGDLDLVCMRRIHCCLVARQFQGCGCDGRVHYAVGIGWHADRRLH